jgi:hypothetical protein
MFVFFPSAGTDTGGSVRVPAAFCGILGFRPSHGAVSTVGVVPMAQSFDTVGMKSDRMVKFFLVSYSWLHFVLEIIILYFKWLHIKSTFSSFCLPNEYLSESGVWFIFLCLCMNLKLYTTTNFN